MVELRKVASSNSSGVLRASLLREVSGSVTNPSSVVGNSISITSDQQIQPNSIDLTVEKVYEIKGVLALFKDGNRRQLPEYHPIHPFTMEYPEGESKMFILEPDRRYQVEFNEKLNVPEYLCGITLVRSTMAKSGCSGENGLFDSGYSGPCGMMVSVQDTCYIERGASIAQMIFLKAESSRLYNGYYQNTESPLDWR